MTAASPLEVLWAVDGRPPLPSANTAGVCAATGAQADVVPLKAGLPSSFNSQHLLRFAGPTAGVSASMHHAMTTWGPVRCADSRWKNSGLMALVIDDHNVTEVTRWQGDPFTVADLLDDLHLLDAVAIVAPTTRKKHSTLEILFFQRQGLQFRTPEDGAGAHRLITVQPITSSPNPDDPLPWDFVVTHHDRGFLVDRWRKRQAFLNQQVARR